MCVWLQDYAAYIGGELASSAVASDTMRPLLTESHLVESLVLELAAAVTAACTAPAEDLKVEAVPQYSAALEAASSLGQSLLAHYLGVEPEALDAVLGITAALAAAASGEEEDKAAIRAEGTDKRFSDPKNLEEEKKNGAAIPPVRTIDA